MAERWDAIVVGGGTMGTATARALAERGRATLLLERFRIGHARGSSHGPTRIFRFAYHHPDYVRMARLALDRWRELESRSGRSLLRTTGGIDLGPGAEAAAQALAAAGERSEWLTGEEVSERWPDVIVEGGTRALFEEHAGVCRADDTVAAQAGLAREAGADVREECPVRSLVVAGEGVEVATDAGSHRAPVAVVTAGAWTSGFAAAAGLDVPVRVSRERVTHFARERPTPLPALIEWSEGSAPPRYAVPDPWRPQTVKLAEHLAAPIADPEEEPPQDPRPADRIMEWSTGRFRGLTADVATETCLYTTTPDEDFVIQRAGPVVIGSPCSGHGFKFTPLIGETLARLAVGEASPFSLDLFAWPRGAPTR